MPEIKLSASSRIFVAGHRGLAGSAIVRRLAALGCRGLILRGRETLDLREQGAVLQFFYDYAPEYVFLAAGKVGGIMANAAQPAQFLYDNLAIQTNVIHAAWKSGVKKLLCMGSSCIYPRSAPQPIREEYLLTGALEPTNEAYAIAKIAGLKMAAAYRAEYGFPAISLMPTNLYGPGDNFDLNTSHVLPAMLRRFHEAKVNGSPAVTIWGTGTPRREFLHADDLASAACFAMQHYDRGELLNVGFGEDVSIAELAETIARITEYPGEVHFDSSKPDGTPRKLLDSSRIKALGWSPCIGLEEGVESTYRWYSHQQREVFVAA